MKILSIDTSTVYGSVALSEGCRLIAQEQQGVSGTHSERLLASIDHLLQLSGWKINDINAICVAIGPGSFTGLRIGLGTAKGIALSLDCPIVGISSLKSLFLNVTDFDGTIVTLIDARRGELYASAYKNKKIVLKECVLPPNDLIGKLKKNKGKIILVGDGALAYRDTLQKSLGKRLIISEGSSCFSEAHNLALLALPRLKKNKCDDLASLTPNYIRRSDAEIGFLGKKK